MIDLDISVDFDEVNKMLHDIETKLVTRAANTAINKTMNSVESLTARLIAKNLGITQKNVKKHLKKRKSNWRTLTAELAGDRLRIPVVLLKARQTRQGVTYRSENGKRKLIPGAFFARMASGHIGVFKRTGEFRRMRSGRFKGRIREAINEKAVVSIDYLMGKDVIRTAIKERAREQWTKEFQHEMNYQLRRKYR